MALLVVIVAVAVLTALAAQLAYSARVRLQLAGDARDELRAMWLAKSGVATSRLVLAFQQQIDASTGSAGGAAGGAGGAAGALSLKIRIWSLVPISSGLVTGLFGGGPAPDAPARPANEAREGPAIARFGDFDGAFEANIEDEGAKVNAQLDAGVASGQLRPGVLALFQLMCDARWEPLFDREDAHGQKTTRQELIQNLRDWVDDKSVTSSLAATFPGAPCDAVVADRAIEDGFGDENFPYDRGPTDERYKTKNARFDSIDELYLVQGYTDAVGTAFGDQLTVYLPRESKRTIDPRNPVALVELAQAIANPPGQAVLVDPEFRARLQKAVMEQTLGGLLGMSSSAFATTLQALGVQVSSDVTTAGSPRNPIGDRSYVYRIRSTGAAGQVSRTLDVVVTYDPNQNRGDGTTGSASEGTSAGRVLRWREE
jgi:general secretion pathway protein K